MMPLGLWVVVGWMVFVGITGIVLLIYACRSGQFENVEEPKYRMLEDREPEDWPDRGHRKRVRGDRGRHRSSRGESRGGVDGENSDGGGE